MKLILKIFIYVSIIGLLYYFYKIDYLVLKNIEINLKELSISLLFLLTGFLFSAISWWYALKIHSVNIKLKQAFVSQSLPVFTKYIPGRVWTILGRAALIKENKHGLKFLTFISFKEQIIYLCLGFFISIYPILRTERIKEFSVIIIALTILMFLLLFSVRVQKFFEKTWNRIFKNKIDLPTIQIREFAKLSIVIVIWWFLWAFGFFYLLKSLVNEVSFYFAFAFPLSVVIGLVAIIFPGGLGIREGVLVLFLVSNGLSTEIAIMISVLARLWFLFAEIFTFLIALLLKRKDQSLYNL